MAKKREARQGVAGDGGAVGAGGVAGAGGMVGAGGMAGAGGLAGAGGAADSMAVGRSGGKAVGRSGGAVGKGGVNPAATAEDATVRVAAEQLVLMDIDELVPYANNAKLHGKEQIAQLRASLREFGFVTPVLIDFEGNIIAGHGRVEAARAEGMREIPCVVVSNLTEAQRKAYILADNRLSETGAWDQAMLRIELEGLRDMDFDTSITGFDLETLTEETDADALTLDDPGEERGAEKQVLHCPRCGFAFEVAT